MARAILALGRRDVKSARLALAAAGDHPLAAHLRGKMTSRGPRVDDEPVGPGEPVGPARPVKPAKRKPVNYARFVALRELKGHVGELKTALMTPDGRKAVTSARDNTTRIWDAETGRVLVSLDKGMDIIGLTPDGTGFMTIESWGKGFNVRSFDTGQVVLNLRTGRGTGPRFAPDGRRLIVPRGHTAVIVDTATRKDIRILAAGHHTGPVQSVDFGAAGGVVATGSEDKFAIIWDAGTGQPLRKLGHEAQVSSVVLGPNGRLVLTMTKGGAARVWDVKTGRELWKQPCASARFDPGGRAALTVSSKGVASIRNAATGRLAHNLKHATVAAAGFSADGHWAVTGSGGGTVRIWHVTTGRLMRELKGHKAPVVAVGFSADGRRIITGSADSTALIWGEPRRR